MKIKIDKNEIRKKQRRRWQIKPFTRIAKDRQKYDRSSHKTETQDIINQEIEANKSDEK